MLINILIQSIQAEDRETSIDALIDLTDQLAKDAQAQEQLIQCLPEDKLALIVECLEDEDADMRKWTAKFLLDLVYNNYLVQLVFCDILGIIPIDGKICLNSIPQSFNSISQHLPDCFAALKQTYPEELRARSPYCWYMRLEDAVRPEKKISFISDAQNKKNGIDGLIDPGFVLMGFVMKIPTSLSVDRSVSDSPASMISVIANANANPRTNKASPVEIVREKSPVSQTKIRKVTPKQKRSANKSNTQGPINSAGMKLNLASSVLTPKSSIASPNEKYNRSPIQGNEWHEAERLNTADIERTLVRKIAPKKIEDRRIVIRKTEPTVGQVQERNNESNMITSHDDEDYARLKTLPDSYGKPKSPESRKISKNGRDIRVLNPSAERGYPSSYENKQLNIVGSGNGNGIYKIEEINNTNNRKTKQVDKEKVNELRFKNVQVQPPSESKSPSSQMLNKMLKLKKAKSREKSPVQFTNALETEGMKDSFWDYIYAYRRVNANALSAVFMSPTSKGNSNKSALLKKEESISVSKVHGKKFSQASHEPLKTEYIPRDRELSPDLGNKFEESPRKGSGPVKAYHLTGGFKNPVTSSRVPQEMREGHLMTVFGKLLSPRKSHDVSYLSQFKKKIDGSSTVYTTNSKKGTKQVNQTVATLSDSLRIK